MAGTSMDRLDDVFRALARPARNTRKVRTGYSTKRIPSPWIGCARFSDGSASKRYPLRLPHRKCCWHFISTAGRVTPAEPAAGPTQRQSSGPGNLRRPAGQNRRPGFVNAGGRGRDRRAAGKDAPGRLNKALPAATSKANRFLVSSSKRPIMLREEAPFGSPICGRERA